MRGLTLSLALDLEGDHLVSRSAELCGFVAMQGEGAHAAP
jgi:protein-L-isoaspartate(D-aspartate) O-methyltransferase